MAERVGVPGRQDPGVATGRIHPLERPLVRCVLVLCQPADEQRREPPVGKMGRRVAHDPLRHLVCVETGVAVGPPALGRDDVRSVARDQVERLACDRLEEAARAALDVRDAVERGVQLGERQRSGVHVGRDDVLGMIGRQQRVNAAAGADVERACDARARRERVAEARGRRVDRNVVGRIVADRQHAHPRNDLVTDRGEPRGLERLDSGPAQRANGLAGRDRTLEEEDADCRRERAVGQPALVGGCVLLSAGIGLVAELLVHRGLGVADAAERRAEPLRRSCVRNRIVRHRAA